MKNMENEILVWSEYRRIKLRLLIMVIGWLPFMILVVVAVPNIFGTYTPSFALALTYMVAMAYTLLMYLGYSCPNCGTSYKGRQLFHQTCHKCGLPINRPAEGRCA
jgi:hypothetical protein